MLWCGLDVCDDAFLRNASRARRDRGFRNDLGRVDRIWRERYKLTLLDACFQPGNLENNNGFREIRPIVT